MLWARFISFLGKDLAMDLGTANTLLYTPKDGIVLNEPSVVALDARDDSVIAVGKEAKEYLGRTPDKIRAIRPMKDGVIADFEVTKKMISFFIQKVINKRNLIKPKIIICVPTGITQVEKRAVIESGQQAGAREVRLIEEPMAAAIGAGLNIHEPEGNMVVDIGGGTTEVAVITLSSIAHSQSVRVAGDEMNLAIMRYVQDEFKLLIGENTAERAKITIGSAIELPEILTMTISGRNLIDGKPKAIEITDAHVREAISDPVAAIVTAVKIALENTQPELVSDIATNGLLLAGGGALLKGLDILINRETTLKVIIDDDPLTTVVRGTGLSLQKDKGFEKVYIN
ncbi:rod shape-determining protein [Desulfovibrio gilichinskyi]|uniref:Cell shape-determining protein MreB n=1 Tax=Desulfovibrio gilichinskyi TaxID=1519643 RepID=A0A1X7CBL0_9BACT|nr:rod shape-determining protein [Desulfovibrio gilichinskyi]SME93545.1 rod shape-determining protein MreB [Desulfovibrio gilichinskyi]